MLELVNKCDARTSGIVQGSDLYPYLAELLEDAPQILLDYLVEDLAEYEFAGIVSTTMLRLFERARCLADVDRIATKFAA